MRHFTLAAIVLALTGCGNKIPEIARDLPAKYAEGERVFDSRLKTAFPAGSSEANLVNTLQSQGFEIRHSSEGAFATFNDGSFLVQNVWTVGWEASDGKITKVWGIYGGRGP